VDGGYVISLAQDTLNDGIEQKGHCLTFEDPLPPHFTDSLEPCLVWNVTTNDGGNTIFIGTYKQNGDYQYLQSGDNDVYIRNTTDDYLYLSETSEGARWRINVDDYSCNPSAVVVDSKES